MNWSVTYASLRESGSILLEMPPEFFFFPFSFKNHYSFPAENNHLNSNIVIMAWLFLIIISQTDEQGYESKKIAWNSVVMWY